MHVGQTIHRLRKERKMTLLELSRLSGVALATLSRIENGRMTGTLESHMHICRALEIALPDLYRDLEASSRKIEMRSKKAASGVYVRDRKAASEMLAPNLVNKKMAPVMMRIASGGNTQKETTRPGIEKFIYILEGRIEASIGGQKYALSSGDTLYFESSAVHLFRNTGKGEARVICVSSPAYV